MTLTEKEAAGGASRPSGPTPAPGRQPGAGRPAPGRPWRLITAVFIALGWGDLLLFIAILVAIVMLHELGHFVTAKWAGMKVTEYFVGFGPRLWSVRRGETEYGVKAIPAGGYVRITGLHLDRGGGPRRTSRGPTASSRSTSGSSWPRPGRPCTSSSPSSWP